MSGHIRRLIDEGEHQMLDFKFEVSDFRKIARTLVAFSNSDGGRLLIGVKDNGSIAGVRSEEEFYMLDGAASLYCRPQVPLKIKEWVVEGRKVLEVMVRPAASRPVMALDADGRWRAYIRQGDQNFRADRVQMKVWQKRQSGSGVTIRYREAERALLRHLEERKTITTGHFRQVAGITQSQAEDILVNFIILGIVDIRHGESGATFRLTRDYEDIFVRYETSFGL